MSYLLLLANLFLGTGLVLLDTHRLKPAEFGITGFVVDRKGFTYTADYWGSQIHKFDAQGKHLQQVAGRGKGPGEVTKPQFLFLMEKQKTLLVIESSGKWSSYNSETGKFIEVISNYLPGTRWERLDDQHLVAIFNNTSKFFIKVNIQSEILESWGERPDEDLDLFWSRRYATGLGPDGQILFQEGSWPRVSIYTEAQKGHVVWSLKPPKHFREAPQRPYNLKTGGFNRAKLNAHLQSFTQLVDFQLLNKRYLVVIWEISEPYERSLDIYDYVSREQVVKDFVAPGNRIFSAQGKVYFIEEREAIVEDGQGEIFMHSYQLQKVKGL